MNPCDYINPQIAHLLLVLIPFLALLIGIRLVQGRPLFTWRDVVALTLILTWAFYYSTDRPYWFGWKDYTRQPLLHWKDIFGDKFC
jgi:hypothetical protein